jgi:hypothetical protein
VQPTSLRHSARQKLAGGIGANGFSGFEPVPFGLTTEVTVNFTIPGTSRLKRNLYVTMIYAGPAILESRFTVAVSPQSKNSFGDEWYWIETT